MATYVWKAMDLAGAKADGEVDAESKQAVADQLKQRGLIVLDISTKGGSKEINISFFQRVKPTDLTIMTRQLSTMVSSGMTILRALYVLEAQTENDLLVDAHHPGAQGRRGGPRAQRRDGAPLRDLLAALRRDDARR